MKIFSFYLYAIIFFGILPEGNLYSQPSKYFKGDQGRAGTRPSSVIIQSAVTGRTNPEKPQNGQIVSQVNSPDGKVVVKLLKNSITQKFSANSTTSPNREKIHCYFENRRVTATDEESFLMQPQQHIFPGSVLDGNSIPRGEFSMIRHSLNPIQLRVQGLNLVDNDNLIQEIESPTPGNITSAISRIVNLPAAGVQPANYISRFEEVKSIEELSIALSAHYTDLANDFSSNFSNNISSSKKIYVMEFSQIYYTVFADIPADSKGFFKNYNANIPDSWMYISEVNYGRKGIVLVSVESENKNTALSASYNNNSLVSNAGAQLSTDLKKSNSKISVKAMIKGGNPDNAAKIFSGEDWENSIKEFFSYFRKGAVFGPNNPAVPLSFVMRFVNDPQHGIGRIEQTMVYQRPVCDDFLKFRIETSRIIGVKIDDGKTGGDTEEIYGRIGFSVKTPSGDSEITEIWNMSPYGSPNTGYIAVKRGASAAAGGTPKIFSIPPESIKQASVKIFTDGAIAGSNVRRGVFEYDPKSSDETYTAIYIRDIPLYEVLSSPNHRKEYFQTFKQGSTSEIQFVYLIEFLRNYH